MRFLRLLCITLALTAPALAANLTVIMGQPTDHSITMGTRADGAVELYFEYGPSPGNFTAQTQIVIPTADPYATGFFVAQTLLDGLRSDSRYYYRALQRTAGDRKSTRLNSSHT